MHQTFHYFAIVEILFDDFSSELRLFIQNACRINRRTGKLGIVRRYKNSGNLDYRNRLFVLDKMIK